MTNYEKYKEQIDKIVRMGRKVALEINTHRLDTCNNIKCANCLFNIGFCDKTALKWADEEYIESKEQVNWSEISVDTPILVKDSTDSDWLKRYFAKYEDGIIYAFYDGRTSWSECKILGWEYAKLAEENKSE